MTHRTAALRAKPSSNFESSPFASVVGTSVVYAVVVVVAAVVYAVAVVVAAVVYAVVVVVAAEVYAVAVVVAALVYAVVVVVAAVVYAVAVVATTVVALVIIDGMRVMLVITVFIVVVFSIFATIVGASTVLVDVVIGEVSLALVALVKAFDTFGVDVLRAVSMLCVSLSAVDSVLETGVAAKKPSVVAVVLPDVLCVLEPMLGDGEANCSLYVVLTTIDFAVVVGVVLVVLIVRLVIE